MIHLAAQAATTLAVMTVVLASGTRSTLAALRASERPRQATSDAADRVAVLTFSNISGDPVDDWIGAGITATVTADLGRAGELVVIGHDAVSAALGSPADGARADERAIVDAAQRLGARWVVDGGYQRVGDRMRITTRVVDVESADTVQRARVDGAISELFDLQDQLVAELRAAVSPGAARAAAAVAERTPPARAPAPAPVSAAPRPPAGSRPAEGNVGSASGAPATTAGTLAMGGFAVAPNAFIDGPPPPIAPETSVRDAAGRATVRAVRVDESMRIDGSLDESAYATVMPVGAFIQQLPDEGASETERTEAWVFYDDRNVYVSGRLWDSAPASQWIANEMQRDSMQLINNEYFTVAFDTFYDRRSGVAFLANAIGGFMDYEITDEGQPNIDWNPIWDVQTGRFDGGWTVEMAIPFKSLRFRSGGSQIWGLQLGRLVRWKNEQAHLTPVPISAGPGMFRLSAAGTLTGVEVPSGSRTFEIKPYAIGSVATDVNAVPRISNNGDGDFGVDAKYGVTQNLTADLTYNTDFAQVEVDEQQVNLTRFSLFFPEKREFFLEGRGIFDFGQGARFGTGGGGGGGRRGGGGFFGGGDVPTVFFSRRIGLEGGHAVPILAGGRLTGKVGDFSIGALNIQTEDAPDAEALATNFTALRIKRDILRRSRIGGIFTGRSVSTKGPGSNEVYGLDAALSFYDNVNVNGYYARSQTPGLVGDDASYQAAFTYNGDLYAFQLDHLLVGDNFNPEIGFLRRDDFRRTFTAAQYSPRPSMRAVRQFRWGGSLDYIETGAGEVETRIAQARFQTEFENSDRLSFDVQESYELLVEPFDIASDVTIPVGGYDFRDFFMSYSLGQQRRVSGSVSFQRGGFFNGDVTAVGWRQGRIEVTPKFSVEPGISINRINLPEGRFTAKLITSRVTYTFTPRMFFGGLVQFNSSSDSLSMNLRLRWEYQPGSELFVVYNDQRDTELRGTPMLENRAFVVKFTRLFRF